MKNYSIYEIVNSANEVEYVGMSTNPEQRFITHTKHKPAPSHLNGKFYKRTDVTMRIVAQVNDRNEALQIEKDLKLKYGFEPTEFAWQAPGPLSSAKVSKGWETRRANGWISPLTGIKKK